VLIEQPGPLIGTVAIIIFGKSIAAFAIVRAFGHPTQTALAVSASLAQIGEFSFILAGLGTTLGILPDEARDLILAGAILSIMANPLIFSLVAGRTSDSSRLTAPVSAEPGTGQAASKARLMGIGPKNHANCVRLAMLEA
jgi:monovalent cation:H+ antiporter-2, CPA2 family